MKTYPVIAEKIIILLQEKNIPCNYSDFGEGDFCIEPKTQSANKAGLPSGSFDGLQLIYSHREKNKFEVSEYMAGKNENELHVFTQTPYLKIAIKSLLRGNKQRPIQIWK